MTNFYTSPRLADMVQPCWLVEKDEDYQKKHGSGMGITVLTTKILVVEDEIAQRRLLTAKLEREGYSVVSAADGR